MALANPFMLLGLLGIGVPLAIHLLQRRRARLMQFGAFDFVFRSKSLVTRTLRLRQFILLLLRCIAVAGLALAAAMPMLGSSRTSTQGLGPAAVIILVDRSMSMRAVVQGRSAWDRACTHVDELLADLHPDSEAAIIMFDTAPTFLSELTGDRSALRDARAKLTVGWRSTDMDVGIRAALKSLSTATFPNKVVFVVTDLAATGWTNVTSLEAPGVQWNIIDVYGGEDVANSAITNLTTAGWSSTRPNVVAELTSFSPAPMQAVTVELLADGEAAGRGFVDLAPLASATKHFTLPPLKSGQHQLTIQKSPDALPDDDTRYGILNGSSHLRIALIDGDPRPVQREAETFYLQRAFDARAGEQAPFTTIVVGADALPSMSLSDFDVVVLANVSRLAGRTSQQLSEFVEHGGGLLIALGDLVEPEQLNQSLGALLPAKVRGWQTAAPATAATGSRVGGGAVQLQPPAAEHEVLSVFGEETLAVLSQVRFEKFGVLAALKKESEAILTLATGTPALVIAPFGQGQVGLFASSLDRSWTDLPISTTFLPLMHRLVRALAGSLGGLEKQEAVIGQEISLNLPPTFDNVRIGLPGGAPSDRIPLTGGLLRFVPDEPGYFQILTGDGLPDSTLSHFNFAANPDRDESNLTRIDEEVVRALFGGTDVAMSGRATRSTDGQNVPVWSALLILFVTCLSLEGWLTRT